MELWASSQTGRHRFLPYLTAVLFFAMVAAKAQQPSENNAAAAPSAAEPAAQPLPQAAQPIEKPESHGTDSSASPTAAPDSNKGIIDSGTARLGPGDLIDVSVYNVPELTTKARVSNSGDVYLPLVDYVHVEGMSQEEAQALIEKRLADGGFVRNPHVTIFVDEAASQGVTVLGEVARPGIYPDVVDHKLYEVISEAGGFTGSASRKIGIIRRNLPQAIQVQIPRNLSEDLTGNVEVLPGDTITVPRAPIIYVVGDVARPSGLLVDGGKLTVLQAIALAGGANHTAKLGGVRILHKTAGGGMTETHVQLKKMLEAKAPDVTLQADDILFVPVSGLRVAAARTAEAAISAATAVSIYTVHP
jgi:polysaccharide biosynthesis/export protein